jgi:hypothetical protein
MSGDLTQGMERCHPSLLKEVMVPDFFRRYFIYKTVRESIPVPESDK